MNKMVRELPVEVRKRIVELWLDGNNLREIQGKTSTSLGSISSLVNEAKKKTPDVERAQRIHLTAEQLIHGKMREISRADRK